MALDGTYGGLLASVADFLAKSNLTAVIPDFVTMAEAEMNRRLVCRQMEALSDFTLAGETWPLPADFLGVRSLRVQTSPVSKLEYVRPDAFDDARDAGFQTGTPYYYSIIGDELVFAPTVDGADLRLRYRQAIPPLAAGGANWLLSAHPDAYLYGALTHSAGYLKDDERASLWSGLFQTILNDINADALRQGLGASLKPQASLVV